MCDSRMYCTSDRLFSAGTTEPGQNALVGPGVFDLHCVGDRVSLASRYVLDLVQLYYTAVDRSSRYV